MISRWWGRFVWWLLFRIPHKGAPRPPLTKR